MDIKQLMLFNLGKFLKLIVILVIIIIFISTNCISKIENSIINIQEKHIEVIMMKEEQKYNNDLKEWKQNKLELTDQLSQIENDITDCESEIDLKCTNAEKKQERLSYLDEKRSNLLSEIENLNEVIPEIQK